jgi:predicted nucleotidyltransferase
MNVRLPIDRDRVAEFCRRWKIVELCLFGSVLRDDFHSDSDVDVLAAYAPEAERSLFDHVAMEEELAAIVGRKVDIVSRQAVERSDNWIRRKAILDEAERLYVA